VTREELHRQVWETPMSRLAEQYGITGNGLAKICDRLNVPYPPRGYWAKKAAGKKVVSYRLPEPDKAVLRSVTIRPTAPVPAPPVLPADVQKQIDDLQGVASSIVVPQRLSRPHKIIAGWLEKHQRELREARNERDPWRKRLIAPEKFTEIDRRRHRVLDALFKELEHHNGVVKDDDQGGLHFVSGGEQIEFRIREKLKQTRRLPTPDEKREWSKWIHETHPTGKLAFSIKTHLPASLRREWLETDEKPMEALLPEIVAVFIAAIPLMVSDRIEQEEKDREAQAAERKRHEEEQKRQLTLSRVRRFTELAHAWRDRQVAREFLNALRATIGPGVRLTSENVEDWAALMERSLDETDPLARGAEFVFGKVAEAHGWSYPSA
jgi:hypothetical protein